MLGNVYGVIEISQDVTDQYLTVRRSVYVVILVAAGLMAFLFIMLALIVRRGERILLLRAIEQKKLEEQLQQSEKMASIGQMIAVVAHEIRNPLGIIKSSAEMLSKKVNPDPSRIKRLSQVIMEEATRLSVILTDFLDFAKPRSPILRDLNIQDVLSRVRENLETELVSRNIEWIDCPTNGTSPIVQGDPDLLYQAFLNIAMNGFEAMKSGGKLEVEILRQNGTLNVTFSDDGHGISDEHLSKIFTPFFTTNQMGTGLGLSVVHNIISAHSGTIEVETKPGEGTSFHIRLPVQE
jgi:signal transduction histidine kinase